MEKNSYRSSLLFHELIAQYPDSRNANNTHLALAGATRTVTFTNETSESQSTYEISGDGYAPNEFASACQWAHNHGVHYDFVNLKELVEVDENKTSNPYDLCTHLSGNHNSNTNLRSIGHGFDSTGTLNSVSDNSTSSDEEPNYKSKKAELDRDAFVLILRGAAPKIGQFNGMSQLRQEFEQQVDDRCDDFLVKCGKEANKDAYLTSAEIGQEFIASDYLDDKDGSRDWKARPARGIVIGWNDLPLTTRVRDGLAALVGPRAQNLKRAEVHLFHDSNACGIGFHW